MQISEEKLNLLKESARAQMADAQLAALMRMEVPEFEEFMRENEDIRRDINQERAAGQSDLVRQLREAALTGGNYPALRDAIKLCGLDLDPKSPSTKVEINGTDVEPSAEASHEVLYLMNRIFTFPRGISQQKVEQIEKILEAPDANADQS